MQQRLCARRSALSVRAVALCKHRFVRLNPRHPLRSQSTSSSSSSLGLDSDPGFWVLLDVLNQVLGVSVKSPRPWALPELGPALPSVKTCLPFLFPSFFLVICQLWANGKNTPSISKNTMLAMFHGVLLQMKILIPISILIKIQSMELSVK